MPDPIPNQESSPPPPSLTHEASRIYFLPNLMTGGTLFCGYLAVIRCIQAKYASSSTLTNEALARERYTEAVWFILAAVIFDALDGRLARLGGKESLFGKEFDSIADIVSFGMAPALMVFFLILSPTEAYPFFLQVGWLIGFLYLFCSAVRLARFNVISNPLLAENGVSLTTEFKGLPVPAAAGMIASLVLVLNSYDLRSWSIFLPVLLLLIAFLMVSNISYPSFKTIDWQTQTRLRTFVYLAVGFALVYLFRSVAISILFLTYIFYGLVRQCLRTWEKRKSITRQLTEGDFGSQEDSEQDKTVPYSDFKD